MTADIGIVHETSGRPTADRAPRATETGAGQLACSLTLFTSDRGIAPAAAAKLADDHGFHTFYVPEHTHIPIKRQAAHP
ncbi:MAG: hypothetical protein QOH20_180, partial [Mycobacterium sp.]|nr:hypothetical protein [Mycobacterium sp.]